MDSESLFKKTVTRYVDADGKRCTKDAPGARKIQTRSRIWYSRIPDAEGIRREVKLCSNKEAAKLMRAKLVRNAQIVRAGGAVPFEEHIAKPLPTHIADYQRHLESKRNTPTHVATTIQRIKAIVDGCKFRRIGEIKASRVSTWLKERRELDGTTVDGQTVRFGIASSNHHLTAVKGFTRWLVRDHRCGDDPLSHLSRLNAKTDVRRERRHITIEQFSKLIEATRKNGDKAGLSGRDRSMLYFLAGYSGLRASELASLTESSFDLDAGTVTVAAAYSKHREQDTLPLPSTVIAKLREWFQERRNRQAETSAVLSMKNAARKAQGPLWAGTWASRRHGAEMLRFDLQAAKIDPVDDRGRVFDFHALRHQFISMLAASGVHPSQAQKLARHSDVNLTMSRYTHIHIADLTSAVETLPTLTPTQQTMQATGTDGNAADKASDSRKPSPVVARMVARAGDTSCDSVRATESRDYRERSTSPNMNARRMTPELLASASGRDSLRVAESGVPKVGLEPTRPLGTLDFESSAGDAEGEAAKQVTESAESRLHAGLHAESENAPCDPRLQALIEAWDRLPEHVRETIEGLTKLASISVEGN